MWGRGILAVLGIALLVAMVTGTRFARNALDVATGYSAKQLCSGVFVAGLPESFIIDNDIRVSLAVMGPLWSQMRLAIDPERRESHASLLGSASHAVYRGDAGCVLNPLQTLPQSRLAPPPAGESVFAATAPPGLQAVIDAAFEEPAAGQRRTLAVLVLRDGALLAERYAEGIGPHTPLQGWSMNKSLMATWIGMQVERGRLDLEAKVAATVAPVDPALARNIDPALNLGHLLHMESGFDFEETYQPGDDATRMLYRSPAMWRVAPGNGHRYPPGQAFSYSSGDTNLASWIWQRSLARPYTQWLEEEFAEPLGLERLTSEHDASGVQVGSSFTYMTARDWGRVGQFWLNAWHGRSALLSREWMRAATTPRTAAVKGNYGRGFWLNRKAADYPTLPRSMFMASGHNSQHVVVFPERELVVVRLGLSNPEAASGFTELLEGVLASLPDSPAPGRLATARPSGQ